MSLHPQVTELLEKMAAAGIQPIQSLSPEDARAQSLAMAKARAVEPTRVGVVEEFEIPGPGGPIPLRLYRPEGEANRLPLLVYFHGGGHVFGSPETHDAVTRNLCAGAHCVVASIHYRLAPEAKFPAAADDCYAATQWFADKADEMNIDPNRIAVGGDSAGGNLAAVVALMAREQGPKLCYQLLVYPVADYACQSDSYARYATGYGILEADSMRWFQGHYLRDRSDADDWRASPIKAASHANLPPALVQTAECDVLHDEGVDYFEALKAAGVPAQYIEYPGMIHGFFGMAPLLDGSVSAQNDAIAGLKAAFGT